MFDIGFLEIFVIGALALIVVGPKELPGLLRTAGQFTAKMKGMAREFQRTMEDAARDADLDGVAKAVKSGGNLNKLPFDNQIVDSIKEFENTVKTETTAVKTAVESDAAPAAATGAAAVAGMKLGVDDGVDEWEEIEAPAVAPTPAADEPSKNKSA